MLVSKQMGANWNMQKVNFYWLQPTIKTIEILMPDIK